jgi:hypothetical protein
MTHDILNRLLRNGLLTELDIHFADFISGLSETTSWTVSLAAALVSNATRQGHICLDLTMIEGRQLLNVDSGNTPGSEKSERAGWSGGRVSGHRLSWMTGPGCTCTVIGIINRDWQTLLNGVFRQTEVSI